MRSSTITGTRKRTRRRRRILYEKTLSRHHGGKCLILVFLHNLTDTPLTKPGQFRTEPQLGQGIPSTLATCLAQNTGHLPLLMRSQTAFFLFRVKPRHPRNFLFPPVQEVGLVSASSLCPTTLVSHSGPVSVWLVMTGVQGDLDYQGVNVASPTQKGHGPPESLRLGSTSSPLPTLHWMDQCVAWCAQPTGGSWIHSPPYKFTR